MRQRGRARLCDCCATPSASPLSSEEKKDDYSIANLITGLQKGTKVLADAPGTALRLPFNARSKAWCARARDAVFVAPARESRLHAGLCSSPSRTLTRVRAADERACVSEPNSRTCVRVFRPRWCTRASHDGDDRKSGTNQRKLIYSKKKKYTMDINDNLSIFDL